jgi:hypothetical protein
VRISIATTKKAPRARISGWAMFPSFAERFGHMQNKMKAIANFRRYQG